MTRISRDELLKILADHRVEILQIWEEFHGEKSLAEAALVWLERQEQVENPPPAG